jgi:cell division protein ZapA
MAQITVEINAKPYVVGCQDGQEQKLRDLAAMLDGHVREVASNIGQLGETRLLLMGALLLADDLEEAKARLTRAQADLTRVQADYARSEARAALALDNAARRIETLAAG